MCLFVCLHEKLNMWDHIFMRYLICGTIYMRNPVSMCLQSGLSLMEKLTYIITGQPWWGAHPTESLNNCYQEELPTAVPLPSLPLLYQGQGRHGPPLTGAHGREDVLLQTVSVPDILARRHGTPPVPQTPRWGVKGCRCEGVFHLQTWAACHL